MKTSRTALTAAMAAAALALAATAPAETYKVDGVHSTVLGSAVHMGASNGYVRFNDVSGSIVLGEKDSAKDSITIVVKTDSLDSANAKRDQHLKGPDFFNAKQFPEMTYKSKSVKKDGDKKYKVEGELTLLGVSKSLPIEFEMVGTAKDPRSGKGVAGGETRFKFKRSDFGMKAMMQGISDEINVIASIEAAAQ